MKGKTVSTKEAGLSNPTKDLEDGAAGFTHLPEAGPDKGVFALSELRERSGKADRGGSRIIALPKGNYLAPPQVSVDHLDVYLIHLRQLTIALR